MLFHKSPSSILMWICGTAAQLRGSVSTSHCVFSLFSPCDFLSLTLQLLSFTHFLCTLAKGESCPFQQIPFNSHSPEGSLAQVSPGLPVVAGCCDRHFFCLPAFLIVTQSCYYPPMNASVLTLICDRFTIRITLFVTFTSQRNQLNIQKIRCSVSLCQLWWIQFLTAVTKIILQGLFAD